MVKRSTWTSGQPYPSFCYFSHYKSPVFFYTWCYFIYKCFYCDEKLAKFWISSYLQVTLAIFKAGLYQNRNKYWIISAQKQRIQICTSEIMIKIFGAKIWMNFSQNDIFSGKLADRQGVQCHASHHILTIIKELSSVDGFCFFQYLQLFQRWLFNSLFSSTWTDLNIQKDQLFTSHFAIYLFLSGKCTTRFQPFHIQDHYPHHNRLID